MSSATSTRARSLGNLHALVFTRWHFSSRFLVALSLLLLIGLNLPGNVALHIHDTDGEGSFYLAPQYEHGWPLIHTVRHESSSFGYFGITFESPTITKCWQFWELKERDQFRPFHLAGNIALSLSMAIVVGVLFEIWRRRHRSLFQIHLLDIGLGMTAIAVILGWYVAVQSAHDREESLLAMYVDEMTENGPMRSRLISSQWETRGPTWLRLWLGDLYFQFMDRVVSAEAYGDEGRRMLVKFHELRKATLAYGDLSEVAQLRQMPQLEELDLTLRVRIEPGSGKAIRLPPLQNLRVLTIRSIENRATGLDQMRNLRVLRMHDSFISEETIHEISRLNNLQELSLNYSYFSPKELAKLRSLKGLKELHLDDTTLRGEDLPWLPEMPSLKNLYLQRSNSCSGVLDHIARCQSLERLYLDSLTESGLRTLSSSPRLKFIEVDYPAGQSVSWERNVYEWTVRGDGDKTWFFSRKTTIEK
jgi:hypothetical protein